MLFKLLFVNTHDCSLVEPIASRQFTCFSDPGFGNLGPPIFLIHGNLVLQSYSQEYLPIYYRDITYLFDNVRWVEIKHIPHKQSYYMS